ncbi:MFS transporter [Sphaerospermopsis aphanizomenoides BCCUSP55]|uniref:MFS transporter n=1 Tax=Sphaerospermopsis aphanizomenoides TaxID=459663 RepID=UPI000A73FEDE|nr:MFS transporter [Sphaerospermopsis aphanizomenoides]MBK1987733.1 MFS transporter [Sphaerospermopsis aphanizomenoides BCCUSP55]
MFSQTLLIAVNSLQSYYLHLGLAPIKVTGEVLTPVQTSFVFSSPKFLLALLSGIVMALAFQLLFTNLSVAAGISAIGTGAYADVDDAETLGGSIRKIEAKVGTWAIFSSSIALFIACFLAVKLSLIESAVLGAIIGVIIWSSYFTIIMWVGSGAVGSLIGSFVSTVTSGIQGLLGTATSAIGANIAQRQTVATAEEITAAVRRELTSGFNVNSIRNTLQNSLTSLPLPKLDVKEIRNQFDQLLKDVDLRDIGDSNLLENINRQTFVDLISSQAEFSPENVNQIADQLESAWKQVINRQNTTEKVIDLLKSASPEELKSEKLGEKLQQLITVGGNGKQTNGVLKQAIQYGLGAAGTAVLERVNLADVNVQEITNELKKIGTKVQDVDVNKIIDQLKQVANQTTEQAGKIGTQFGDRFSRQPENTIKADVEEYIRNSFPWHFNQLTIKDEFRDVIYDPNADPSTVRRQLEEINQDYFVNLLQQRGDISADRIQEIAKQLTNIRQDVFQIVQQGEKQHKSQNLRSQIEDYLRNTNQEELNPEGIERNFSTLLEDPEAGFTDLQERLREFDRNTFVQLLQQRQDISEEEANNIVGQLESTRDNILNRAREWQEQARNKADELRQRVEDYLRNTNKEELNPDAIKRDFRVLLEDPQAGINLLRDRLSQFDRDTLVQLLSQRQDLSEEQINQALDALEGVRDNILQVPQKVVDKAKEQYEQTTTAIAEYLRNTNLEELNPEGIQRDLQKLFSDPKQGVLALRDRLSKVDKETLVKLLSQREDLSEEQVNQIINSVQTAINNIVKAPQRLAQRTTKQVLDFEANLENYLRNTHKEELNPEGIKRDLQLLLSSPRAGIGSLGDRVSRIDRSTLVALLSQREDISEAEANRIVDQIESVRDSIVEQFEQIQQRVRSLVDRIFGRIRDYLNSLERPELNYEGIQQDFAKIFDDPQAGFEALRDRLSHFDRDTLVAILSSRPDISEEQANQIINRVESARDSVLHQAERIQQETQRRLQVIREQAKQQAIDSKKALADAAWWLFNAAVVSLVASAVAGVLAVITPNPIL